METKNSKKVRVVKGQDILDTAERQKEFMRKNSIGWEDTYKKYVRDWYELPKNKIVRDYPPQVDLELATICNLKCPMCFTVNKSFKQSVNQTFMDFELFKKIIDEITGKVYKIHLSLRGEPTLNPNFIDCVAYAKQKGIGEVSTVTNGSKLDLDFFIQAANAGMDRFTISIDGLESEYNRIRRPMKFQDILEKLKAIKKYKDDNNLQKPVIKIQGVWPSIRPNPTEFYNTFYPYVDLISYNPLADWRHNDNDIEYEENFSCGTLYQRLVVGADGLVIMCINDEDGEVILGNAYNQTIFEIWHSEKLNNIRQLHRENMWNTLSPCLKCLHPRKTEINEQAFVGNREIWVENYTNRNQKIGK